MDDAARQRALDIETSFIVQAPAGSGKTELLTQRMLALLAGVKHPEDIVAVTFTRKAAAEMRARLLQALRQPEACRNASTVVLAQRAAARSAELSWHLSENPNRLRIMTIDALCKELALQRPTLSKLGTTVDLLDDTTELYSQVVAQWIRVLFDDPDYHDALRVILHSVDNQLSRLKDYATSLLAIRDQWLPTLAFGVAPELIAERMQESFGQYLHHELSLVIEQITPEAQVQLAQCLKVAYSYLGKDYLWDALPEPELSCLSDWQDIARTLLTQEGAWRKTVTKLQGFASASEPGTALEKQQRTDAKRNILALIGEFSEKERIHQVFQTLSQMPHLSIMKPMDEDDGNNTLLPALLRVLPVLVHELHQAFRRSGQVDFLEMTFMAIQAVDFDVEQSDVALKYDYSLNHLLIDEFQDTSRIQFRLFKALTKEWFPGDGKTLFLVGDPMQSIYRFRGADVSVFLSVQQEGLNEIKPTVLRLVSNFRSSGRLIGHFNEAFQGIFPQQEDALRGGIPFYASVAQGPGAPEDGVFAYAIPEGRFAKRHEAFEVTRLAMEAIEKGHRTVILGRSRSHLNDIVESLQKLLISFVGHELQTISMLPWVMDFFQFSCALHDAHSRLAWLSVLRAPYIGLSLGELLKLSEPMSKGKDRAEGQRAGERKEGVQALPMTFFEQIRQPERLAHLKEPMQRRLHRLFQIIDKWKAHHQRKPLDEWVYGAWVALGAPQAYPAGHDQDIQGVLALLRSSYGHYGFFHERHLATQLERRFRTVAASEADTLHVMTIHKAKGLEFDTVILPGLSQSVLQDDPAWFDWMAHDLNGNRVWLLATADTAATPAYHLIQHARKSSQVNEAKRLLYVACTRAKVQLHLLGAVDAEKLVPSRSNTYWAMLWPFVGDAATIVEEQGGHVSHQTTHKTLQVTSNPGVAQYYLDPSWVLPKNLDEALALTAPMSVDAENAEVQKSGQLLSLTEHKPAALLGTLLHRILEQCSRLSLEHVQKNLVAMSKNWPNALIRMGCPRAEALTLSATALQWMQKIPTCSVAQWIFSQQHTQRKAEWVLPDVVQASSPSAPGNTAKGSKIVRLDLSFVDAEQRRWIVDFKTQKLDPLQQKAAMNQLLHYAKILQHFEQGPVYVGIYAPLDGTKWQCWIVQVGALQLSPTPSPVVMAHA
ncbi:MAG: UvrD-helicase domain-containing protein [Pseudomonadota bacterium]